MFLFKKKKFRYFISYSIGDTGNTGFGCSEVHTSCKIDNFEDLKKICKSLKTDFNSDETIVILYYREI